MYWTKGRFRFFVPNSIIFKNYGVFHGRSFIVCRFNFFL